MHNTYPDNIVYTTLLHSATTATTTSNAEICAGAKAIKLVLTKAATDANLQATLTVTVSPDGTNFYAYNMILSNIANANTERLTRVASVVRLADGTDIMWFTPETLGAIQWFKVVLTMANAGSGTFDVTSVVQY